jgi:serine/threonine protein kinase
MPRPAKKLKVLAEGTFCRVYDGGASKVLKVMPSEQGDGLSPSQLRECNFYSRMKPSRTSMFVPFDVIKVRSVPSNWTHSISAEMPRMVDLHDAMTRYPTIFPVNKRHRWLLALVDDLTRSLYWMHTQGVLHRDIKPSNILFDVASEQFFLIDFGSCNLEKVQARTRGWCTYWFTAPEAGPLLEDFGDDDKEETPSRSDVENVPPRTRRNTSTSTAPPAQVQPMVVDSESKTDSATVTQPEESKANPTPTRRNGGDGESEPDVDCNIDPSAMEWSNNYDRQSDVFSLAATILAIALDFFRDPQQTTWEEIGQTHPWPRRLKHWRTVLIAAVNPDPLKRASLHDIRSAIGLPSLIGLTNLGQDRCSNVELTRYIPPSRNTVLQAMRVIDPNVDSGQARSNLITWVATLCHKYNWDKLTLITTCQLFDDVCGMTTASRKPVNNVSIIGLLVACLSLAHKVVDDEYQGLADFLCMLGNVCKGSELFVWELQVWQALDHVIMRRSIEFEYLAMPWLDLCKYLDWHTV